jgi:purine-binding chemotaxis protein CheW
VSKQATKRNGTKRGGGKASPAQEVPTGPDRVYAFADRVQDDSERETQAPVAEAKWETWVTFRLAAEVFAFTVESVREIVRVGTVTRVPHAPYPVRGIINLRGRVVPVVDLRVRIGLPRSEITPQSRVLIATVRQRMLGLLVDSVEQVVRVDRNQVTAPPSDVMTEQSEYIVGVVDQHETLFILLDSERVFLIPEGLESPGPTSEAA